MIPLASLAAVAAVAVRYADHIDTCVLRLGDSAGANERRNIAVTIDPHESMASLAARIAAAGAATDSAAVDCLIVTGPCGLQGPEETSARYVVGLDPATGAVVVVRGQDAEKTNLLQGILRRLAHQLGSSNERPVRDYGLLDEAEAARILHEFNDTTVPFPSTLTLHCLLDRQASQNPGRIAVSTASGQLSYRELADRAEQLSTFLRRRPPGSPGVVGVLMQRSLDLPVALFGILGAGRAYLPLDPHAPQARLRQLVEQCGVETVLADHQLVSTLDRWVDVFSIDDPALYIRGDDRADTESRPKPHDLCYVIHTSGSTGTPKGVMVEHRSVINRLAWMQRRFPLGPDDVVLQKTPIIFDVSVWELFWAALAGARVHFMEPGAERFPLAIEEVIEQYRITIVHFVPSMLNVFLSHVAATGAAGRIRGLRWLFSSGESLLPAPVASFLSLLGPSGTCRLVNLYGPTEATVDVTAFECPSGSVPARIPIGKPIDNTRVYVLRHGQPVPIGVAGTLFVAGVGVARGYVADEVTTAERFVPEYGRPTDRMYDTGDIARWTDDGELEYLGRADLQIKIRGIRVELEEIEHVLLRIPEVTGCAVRVEEPNTTLAVLRAAVSGSPDLTAVRLRADLGMQLSGYLIPASFDYFAELPRTPSGKIDRARLADPDYVERHGRRL